MKSVVEKQPGFPAMGVCPGFGDLVVRLVEADTFDVRKIALGLVGVRDQLSLLDILQQEYAGVDPGETERCRLRVWHLRHRSRQQSTPGRGRSPLLCL